MKISILIPCFNEQDNIKNTVEEIINYVKKEEIFYNFSLELILINDGSTDDTLLALNTLEKQYPVIKIINFERNVGRGKAIKEGIISSSGEYVIPLDADLSYDVQHIKEILSEFVTNPAIDVVVVSVYAKGGKVGGVPFGRLLLSKIANWILAGFFEPKLSTVTCVVRGYRGSLIRKIKFFEDGKELHLEILRKLILYGANIKEIPGRLIWKKQKNTPRRKNNLKVFNSAKKHLLYALMMKPTKLFGVITLLLLFVGLYESIIIGISVMRDLDFSSTSYVHALWISLSKAYAVSPHTFFFALSGLIIGIQAASFLALFQVIKQQQEETLRHVLALLEDKSGFK